MLWLRPVHSTESPPSTTGGHHHRRNPRPRARLRTPPANHPEASSRSATLIQPCRTSNVPPRQGTALPLPQTVLAQAAHAAREGVRPRLAGTGLPFPATGSRWLVRSDGLPAQVDGIDANPSGKDDLFTVSEAIRMFDKDVGPAYTTVHSYRWCPRAGRSSAGGRTSRTPSTRSWPASPMSRSGSRRSPTRRPTSLTTPPTMQQRLGWELPSEPLLRRCPTSWNHVGA